MERPTTLNMAERRLNITGQITGWFFIGASSGGMFLPWLIGQFFQSRGPQTTMLIFLFDMFAVTLVFLALVAKGDSKDQV